ncbi:MAG: glutathione S-transferase [Alphaproteobacteria bacterium]|nr:glutathione S-transferase [Alphaproteobacteria bacterium]
MLLYDFKMAPNARRVRVFAAEKGLDIPMQEVDLGNRAQLGADYLAVNPMGEVPALVLDDGTVLTESTAICRYLEEVYPDPPLCGRNPLERAQMMMWDRRVEQHGFAAVAEGFRNGNPFFKDRSVTGTTDFAQLPELAERGKQRFANFLELMEQRLGESEFVGGDRFSIADITALITIDFARTIKGAIGEHQPNLKRWYGAVNGRPSAKA